MNIAICDDEIFFAQKIENLVKQYAMKQKIAVSISVFTSAKDFLNSELEDYNIIFLDVLIGDINGMDTARCFREKNNSAVLIFVSGFAEYAHRGYELNTFRYLLKENLNNEFFDCMKVALYQIKKQSLLFKFKTTDGEIKMLPLSEIMYFESLNHNVFVHLFNSMHKTYDSLSKIEAQLPLQDFLRVQRSYIVNMRNVVATTKYCEIILSNTDVLSCSRTVWDDVQKRFIEIQGEC